jgi:hypothetical protein
MEQDRQKAYKCDITYGTASEFGFDFLRDRFKVAGAKGHGTLLVRLDTGTSHGPGLVPTSYNAVITMLWLTKPTIFSLMRQKLPLAIAGPTKIASPEECSVYQWADGLARQMVLEKHFKYDMKKQKIELTPEGHQLIRWSNPPRTGAESLAVDKLHERLEASSTRSSSVPSRSALHDRQRQDCYYRRIDGTPDAGSTLRAGVAPSSRSERRGADSHAERSRCSDYLSILFSIDNKLSGMTGTAAAELV